MEMINKKFGRLTILEELQKRNKYGKKVYKCVCDCGNIRNVDGHSLRCGNTKSCGCLQHEYAKSGKANRKHGFAKTRLDDIYFEMKRRCYDDRKPKYKDYGARGIRICDEWLNDKTKFFDWAMENGYKENLTIDRIDIDGNYEPSNCKWSTQKEQANNRRTNINITYKGKTQTVMQWAEELNLNPKPMYKRYHAGWSVEEILFGKKVK